MNRLLFLNYSNHDACSFYRSAGIAKDLREKGFDIDVVQIGAKTLYWSDLLMYDVVMIQRPYTFYQTNEDYGYKIVVRL